MKVSLFYEQRNYHFLNFGNCNFKFEYCGSLRFLNFDIEASD